MLQLVEEKTNRLGEVYIRYWADANLGVLVNEWQVYATSDEFRAGIERSLALFRAHNLRYLVGNMKNMAGTFDENNEWLEQEIAAQFVAAGLRRNYMVVADDLFARISAEFFREQEMSNLVSEPTFFSSVDDAVAQIRKVEQQMA